MKLLVIAHRDDSRRARELVRICEQYDLLSEIISDFASLEENIGRFLRRYSHTVLILHLEIVQSGVINFLAGFYHGLQGRIVIYNPERLERPAYLDRINVLYSIGDIQTYFMKSIEIWKEKRKRYDARMRLKNQGINFSEDSFFRCIHEGEVRAVEFFIDGGLSPNQRDMKGVSALSIAVRRNHTVIVDALLKRGADVNMISEDRGHTPLMDAASNGNVEMTRLLLEAGADVDHTSKNGQTALILAAGNKSLDIVAILSEAGADKTRKDSLGMRAYDYALLFSQPEMIDMLK